MDLIPQACGLPLEYLHSLIKRVFYLVIAQVHIKKQTFYLLMQA